MVSANPLVYLPHDIVYLFRTQASQIWTREASFVQDIFYQDESRYLDLQLSSSLLPIWQDPFFKYETSGVV